MWHFKCNLCNHEWNSASVKPYNCPKCNIVFDWFGEPPISAQLPPTVTRVISDAAITYDENQVYDVPLSEVFMDNEFNCRGYIDANKVIELARDIADKGLSTPILLQKWNNSAQPTKRFRIVSGYRRFKAHQINQAETIRALIRNNVSELDARVLNLTENIQRLDLNILQEAKAIDAFRVAGWQAQKVAQKLGKSYGWVQVRYMVNELPPEIQNEAAANLFTQQQIRDLHSLRTNREKFEYVKAIKDKKDGVKKKEPNPDRVKVKNERRNRTESEIFAMQDRIREVFGNGPMTRALAWAGGAASDSDFEQYLNIFAKELSKVWLIPEGLVGSKAEPRKSINVENNPVRSLNAR